MSCKKETYKRLGDYIREVDVRNSAMEVNLSQGICNMKYFQDPRQVSSTPHLDKIVRTGQFAYNRATTRNGNKISIAYREGADCTVSSAYCVFYITDENVLNPYYLWLWFKRPNFDRYAIFKSHGSAHEFFEFETLCNTYVPMPPIEEQEHIVDQYLAIQKRIENNKKTIAKLEETAQAIYRKMFVDDIDLENLPEGWRMGTFSDIAIVTMGQSPSGETLNKKGEGILFYQGCSDFGIRFVIPRVYTTAPTKYANPFDILMSVRAPVGSLNITKEKCCIGRGLAAIKAKLGEQSFVLYTLKNQSQAFTIADDDGSVFGSINKDGINNLSIILPPDSLINEFNKQVSPMDELIVQYESEINVLTNMLGILL